VLAPLASPGDRAEQPLGREIGGPQRAGRRLEVRIGQMGEAKRLQRKMVSGQATAKLIISSL
jgi:hypothetical protein